MNLVQGQVFEKQRILLDYSIWDNNSFHECVFVVSVGEFMFNNNECIECKLEVRGRAEVVLRFADMLYPGLGILKGRPDVKEGEGDVQP